MPESEDAASPVHWRAVADRSRGGVTAAKPRTRWPSSNAPASPFETARVRLRGASVPATFAHRSDRSARRPSFESPACPQGNPERVLDSGATCSSRLSQPPLESQAVRFTSPEPDFARTKQSASMTTEIESVAAATSVAPTGSDSLRPFFGFYGGKWRDALKHYEPPRHQTVVEPFAGSAGYSVRYADRKVVLGEIDEVIFGVWQYLIHASATEIRSIPDLQAGQTVSDLKIPQEARWLVGFWLNRGASRPRVGPSAWMRQAIRPGSFWGERVRETIASQVEGIRHWRVYNCSYEEIGRYVRGGATWFIDPPYQHQGKHYHHGAEGIDFAFLGDWCRTRTGQVIVCENEGANWLPFRTLADVKTTRAASRSVEVVWTNDSCDERSCQASRS